MKSFLYMRYPISSFLRFFLLFVIGMAALPGSLFADDYHSIQGFFGERASGLAGAFSAVADDPSGTYYNPAGIAFAYDTYISISASTFDEKVKTYENIYSPGQDYTRMSRRYLPNFIGAIKNTGDFQFGFSIITPQTENFDQGDILYDPLFLPEVASWQNEFTQDTNVTTAGPTLAYTISDTFSVGATLYYFLDSSRITTRQFLTWKSGGYQNTSVEDRRNTHGVEPILGFQYMPIDKLSLGGSYRKKIITHEHRRLTSTSIPYTADTTQKVRREERSVDAAGLLTSGGTYYGSGVSGGIPETEEYRVGAAFFFSRYFMVTGDIIHTTGFSESGSNWLYNLGPYPYLILYDKSVPYLKRNATTNYAAGLEYYITESFAIRLGAYTNRSNNQDLSWSKGVILARLRQSGAGCATAASGSLPVFYCEQGITTSERYEAINTNGYTLGFSIGDSSSSLSLSVSSERGSGISQIDSGFTPQTTTIKNVSFLIVASTRQ